MAREDGDKISRKNLLKHLLFFQVMATGLLESEWPSLLVTSVDVTPVTGDEVEFDALSPGDKKDAVMLVDVREVSEGKYRGTNVSLAEFQDRVRKAAEDINAEHALLHIHGECRISFDFEIIFIFHFSCSARR